MRPVSSSERAGQRVLGVDRPAETGHGADLTGQRVPGAHGVAERDHRFPGASAAESPIAAAGSPPAPSSCITATSRLRS